MKTSRKFTVVMVTCPDIKTARNLIKEALHEKLVACGNIVPSIESHYWWQGKLERSAEVLILFKTVTGNLPRLEGMILKNHPYETPEIIALPLSQGTPGYLDWLESSVETQR